MKKTGTLISACMLAFAAQGQITVQDSLDTSTLADLLEGIGVTVTNVTVDCAGAAMGRFSGTSEMPITQGIVLTSGCADCVAGASTNMASAWSGTGGDADLDQDLGMSSITMDACAVEFDCLPDGDTLLFNFSFGSEEYQEFVGSSFNDAFAIYLTGPGFPTPTNVAAIPGGTLVSINNVNTTTNSTYYYDNENPAGQFVSYDGFTANLTAFAVVQPGASYHFKVVVADVMDGVYDSGVFLEAFSFRSAQGFNTGLAAHSGAQPRITLLGNELLITGNALQRTEPLIIWDATGRQVLLANVTGDRHLVSLANLRPGTYAAQLGSTVLRFAKD